MWQGKLLKTIFHVTSQKKNTLHLLHPNSAIETPPEKKRHADMLCVYLLQLSLNLNPLYQPSQKTYKTHIRT